MIQHLTDIVVEARKKGKKRLAVAYGQDSHTLEAVYNAYKEGLVEPTLFGEKAVIEQVCRENDIDINAFTIVDEKSDVKCVQLAVAAVVAGVADVLMKGLVSTDKYMRGILNKEAGLFPPKGVLSHVSVIEIPSYHKLITVSDVAVIPLPDFKQKQKQIGYLAQTAKLLGIATPKIACIAPSEQLLPSVISSTEGAILAKMGDRGQLGNDRGRSAVDRRGTLQGGRRPQEGEGLGRSRRPGLPALPQHRVGQRVLQGRDPHGRRRDRSHGHGYEGSVRADLARRLQQDQTLLDRTGLSGSEIIGKTIANPDKRPNNL